VLRAGYARLVESEIFRIIEGQERAAGDSRERGHAPRRYRPLEGVPELIATVLVRKVLEPKEFHEFCQFDC
jgi:hypothetical protein